MSLSVRLQPTFQGHVATTQDALILFEACIQHQLPLLPRRPHSHERELLIRSGGTFIYEERSSGIRRWNDGIVWSPSRILGNFLVYRELNRRFTPDEQRRISKDRNRRPSRTRRPCTRPEAVSDMGGSPLRDRVSLLRMYHRDREPANRILD